MSNRKKSKQKRALFATCEASTACWGPISAARPRASARVVFLLNGRPRKAHPDVFFLPDFFVHMQTMAGRNGGWHSVSSTTHPSPRQLSPTGVFAVCVSGLELPCLQPVAPPHGFAARSRPLLLRSAKPGADVPLCLRLGGSITIYCPA